MTCCYDHYYPGFDWGRVDDECRAQNRYVRFLRVRCAVVELLLGADAAALEDERTARDTRQTSWRT